MLHHVARTEHLLEFSPSGTLSTADVIALIHEHYRTLDDRDVLWDFTHVTVNNILPDDQAEIAMAVLQWRSTGRIGKTAFVAPSGDCFGRMWCYCKEAYAIRVPVEYHVFGRREPALAWLARKPAAAMAVAAAK